MAGLKGKCTGNFFIDDAVLRAEGVSDFGPYAMTPGEPAITDLFLDRLPASRMDIAS